jgi:uncharacterized lipoprotein YbaY
MDKKNNLKIAAGLVAALALAACDDQKAAEDTAPKETEVPAAQEESVAPAASPAS